jgi:hypothetical protein
MSTPPRPSLQDGARRLASRLSALDPRGGDTPSAALELFVLLAGPDLDRLTYLGFTVAGANANDGSGRIAALTHRGTLIDVGFRGAQTSRAVVQPLRGRVVRLEMGSTGPVAGEIRPGAVSIITTPEGDTITLPLSLEHDAPGFLSALMEATGL